jgi:hypothetical protein
VFHLFTDCRSRKLYRRPIQQQREPLRRAQKSELELVAVWAE